MNVLLNSRGGLGLPRVDRPVAAGVPTEARLRASNSAFVGLPRPRFFDMDTDSEISTSLSVISVSLSDVSPSSPSSSTESSSRFFPEALAPITFECFTQ